MFGFDIEQPQQYLRLRVGKLLFEDGRTRDAERYFRSFNPYEFFSTTQAELYLGWLAEARGRPEEAATHYGRFVRWWRYADERSGRGFQEARKALSRLAGEKGSPPSAPCTPAEIRRRLTAPKTSVHRQPLPRQLKCERGKGALHLGQRERAVPEW